MRYGKMVLAALVALGAGACSDDDMGTGPEMMADPIATVAIDGGFSELVAALSYVDTELGAGLVDLFSNDDGPFTVFAPTNAAFEDLYTTLTGVLGSPIDEITDLPPEVVLSVLQYHVVAGEFLAASVVPGSGTTTVTPLIGESFAVRADGTIADGLTGVRSGDAAIATADVAASNGVVHVITKVIVPPSVVSAITS